MRKLKWMAAGGKVYPYCVGCGAYPMRLAGVTESGYIMKCFGCGKVVVRKTHPNILEKKAVDRWRGSEGETRPRSRKSSVNAGRGD